MCGIVFLLEKNRNTSFTNKQILDSLYSRGPDGNSIAKYKHLTLGHTRLAIQNVTDEGVQPMVIDDSILIYNGEIYNCKELANKYNIDMTLDTDLIIKLYNQNKKDFFEKILPEFDGIFSFIILDKKLEKIFIVRDMVGVKPLYYYDTDDFLCISSSIKTFYEFDNLELNKKNIYEFWNFRQCLDNKTILNNVKSYKNSYYTEINLHGKLIKETEYISIENNKTEQYDLNILKRKINESMENNLISDPNVKLGCFLSGGVDSSYIYNYCRSKKKDLYSYSVGFKNCNEFEYVDKLIDNDSKHKNIEVSIEEYFINMIELINNKGNVLQVPNEVLISIICKHAKDDGLKVLLAGEGADEIFHGYGKIFNLFLKNTDDDFITNFIKEYKYCKDDNIFLNNVFDNQEIIDFFSKFDNNIHKQDLISKIFLNFHIQGLTNRLDAGSMSQSIEARVPFLNQSLVKYVYNNVPRSEKIKRNYDENKKYDNYKELSEAEDTPKYCLKKIAEEILPKEIIYRKKVGFVVPIEDINNKQIRNLIFKILSKGYICKHNLINKTFILEQVINKTSELKYIIFNLINLEIFIQLFIEKISIDKVKEFVLQAEKMTIGYTCGVYDLFHVGHLNILEKAKEQCDFLIVAVTADDKVKYKGKIAIINEKERKEIVNGCRYTDLAIYQHDHDKFEAWKNLNFDVLIVGDDWKGHENWIKWEKQLNEVGARVHYEPYTKGVSSTGLRKILEKL